MNEWRNWRDIYEEVERMGDSHLDPLEKFRYDNEPSPVKANSDKVFKDTILLILDKFPGLFNEQR